MADLRRRNNHAAVRVCAGARDASRSLCQRWVTAADAGDFALALNAAGTRRPACAGLNVGCGLTTITSLLSGTTLCTIRTTSSGRAIACGARRPRSAGLLFFRGVGMMRVAHVDGFDLGHAVSDRGANHLKWLDQRAECCRLFSCAGATITFQ